MELFLLSPTFHTHLIDSSLYSYTVANIYLQVQRLNLLSRMYFMSLQQVKILLSSAAVVGHHYIQLYMLQLMAMDSTPH